MRRVGRVFRYHGKPALRAHLRHGNCAGRTRDFDRSAGDVRRGNALMNRAKDETVFDKTVSLINDFKQYYIDYGQPIYENQPRATKPAVSRRWRKVARLCPEGRTRRRDGYACVRAGVPHAGTEPVDRAGQRQCVDYELGCLRRANDSLYYRARQPARYRRPNGQARDEHGLAVRKRGWIDFNAGILAEGEPFHAVHDNLWRYLLDVASGRARTKMRNPDTAKLQFSKTA